MAEGLINHFFGNKIAAFSAEIKTTNVNPFAIDVMKEIDIDISGHHSKNLSEFDGQIFD